MRYVEVTWSDALQQVATEVPSLRQLPVAASAVEEAAIWKLALQWIEMQHRSESGPVANVLDMSAPMAYLPAVIAAMLQTAKVTVAGVLPQHQQLAEKLAEKFPMAISQVTVLELASQHAQLQYQLGAKADVIVLSEVLHRLPMHPVRLLKACCM